MAHLKIACHQCSEYADCSSQTKAFVNYCGSNKEHFRGHIHKAIQECRSRRGYMLKHDALSALRLKKIVATLKLASV